MPTRASARPGSQPAGTSAAASSAAFETADRLHSAAIHLLRRVRREDDSTGLPAPQTSALSVIVFRGPLTLSQLAEAEQVRAPSITRIVAALEAAGLVARESPESDRRVTYVRATKRGRDVLDAARGQRIAVIANAIAELRADDMRRLRDGVQVLEELLSRPALPERSRSR